MGSNRFWRRGKSKSRQGKERHVRPCLEVLEDRTAPSANSIVTENQLPGTPQSVWGVSGAGDPSIQGFATDISVNHGQTISFKVNDLANASYHIDIYRMGYYQGNGARLEASIASSQVLRQVQPKPLTDASTGLVDAGNWSVSASWAVASTALSGIYMARLTRDDTGGASIVYFVVRADESTSDLLFQTSDSTWQAYNNWDGSGTATTLIQGSGNSLYVYGGNNPVLQAQGRATEVSYNRPLIVDATAGGFGDYNSPLHAEYPMVRWLEANGYDVSYTTDVDSARNGNLILNHKVFLSVGHDEYWSAPQRASVQAARDAGVNLAFFSGNEVYWETRWQASTDSSATAYRTLVCYKQSEPGAPADPLDSSPTWYWTGTWRDINGGPPANGGQPENGLTGTMYMADRTSVDLGLSMTVPAVDANLRFWRNTSVANLQSGQTATLGQFVVGYETDQDVANSARPAGLIDMAATTFNTQSAVVNQSGTQVGPGTSTQNITLYRAPSGALVFGAGTVQWSWGLDGHHNDTPSTPDPAIQQATVNLLADMNVQPSTLQSGLVAATASTDVTPPTSVITSPTAGASLTVGSTVTITGTASDAGGSVVAGVEVSVDGGQTWHPASGRSNWTYTWVLDTPGQITLKSRAVDDSGNLETPSAGVTVSVSYQATSTTGLVAAFNFDEGSGTTVHDSSGNGNNGTITGATWTTGLFGSALSFNGANSWVTVNDSSSLHLTSGMTLEAWVDPTALAANWSAVMMKERPSGLSYALYATDGANQPPAAYIDSSSTDYDSKGLTNLPLNAWSFLTGTYDGTNLDLYVNGTLVNALSVSGLITTSNGALRIGGDAIWGEYFQGLIDNIRIYNRRLNQGEIRSDMNTPVGSNQVETTAPTGAMMTPTSGATVSGVTTLVANASDNVMVHGVQFKLNGANLGALVTASPYSLAWDTRTVANGTYTIAAVVSDAAGNSTTLNSITVTVNNPPDTTPPAIRITNPSAIAYRGTIVPMAVASDNIGVISVQFQLNGVNLGPQLTAAPYRFAWDTTSVADGTYTLTAVARDAAGNTTISSPVSVTVRNAPPAISARTPTSGATGVSTSAPNITATFNEAVLPNTISITLTDSSGNSVLGSVAYNSQSNTATFTPSGDLDPLRIYTVTISGARDAAGNVMTPVSWSFTTTSTVINATIWANSATPAVASANDFNQNELGVKFTSDTAGYITGIRFYKGSGNTGTHTGHLWSASGTLLASATFTNETATGWQQVNFSQPVAVAANTTYVASYFAPNGGYAYDSAYFASAGVDAGVLHALSNSAGGGDGVYNQGSSAFPNNSYNSTNYWVDVVFSNVLVPAVTATTPASGATGVSTTLPSITATFSKPVQQSTISFTLTGPGGAVAATMSYNSSTNTATLTPSAALAGLTTYTATVSGAQDAAGQTITPVTWSFATATLDTTPPTITATTPASGATLSSLGGSIMATFSKPVQASTISFVLKDSGGNVVASTLTYNSSTNAATLTPATPLAVSTTYMATVSGATDLAGNTMSATSWSFTTAGKITNASIWASSATPAVASANDSNAQELGVKFSSDTGGYITGIRFYKGAGNTGTHIGYLWSSTGTLLASATFTGETALGWQQVNFSLPVAIQAHTTYVASYYAPVGHYSYTSAAFASAGVDNVPLHALSNAAGGGNGVFVAGAANFPTNSYNSTNYFVDVVFSNVLVPTVTATTPLANATGVSTTNPNITVNFNEDVKASSINFTLADGAGNPVAATVTWQPAPEDDTSTDSLLLTPHSALLPSTTYTATISNAVDAAGNNMAGPFSWSFTTAIPFTPITNATIWSSSTTPTVASANDSNPQELGVKFTSDVTGYITGIRFYKGTGNTGTHTGHLWSSNGTLLASATFTGESALGWQQVNFTQPVAIQANTTYVASYYTSAGHYAYSSAYFASSGADNGVLHALSNTAGNGNGVYADGASSVFPNNSYNATNYWIDVVFSNVLTPTITSETPAPGATGVSPNSGVVITFNEAMNASTITNSTFYLRVGGSSTNVAANVSYSGTTATLTPSAPLALNTTYQVTVAAGVADTTGNTLGSDNTWTFATQKSQNFTDTTVADFSAGTPDANTTISQIGDGELILKPTEDAEFSGASLPSDWTSTILGSGGVALVSGGQLTLDGAMAGTSALYSVGQGRSLEFMATFSGDAYQHAGLAVDLNSAPWAIFSTLGGGALYARSSNGASSINTLIAGNWLGMPHDYRIDWTSTSITYWIDGTQVASHAVAISANMRPLADDNNVSGGTVSVDWMHLTPYASSATYLSRIFDAGQAVTWLDGAWASVVPSGASLAISVRMGNTQAPDSSWTDFIPLASSGATIGGSSRYAQYMANLASSNLSQTPQLQAMTLDYTTGANTVPPTVLSETPASGSTGVGLFTPIVVKFSELMNPASINTSTVYLRATGSSTNVAATVTYTGSTATLQPTAALTGNTTYQATVSTGVTDSTGNALASSVSWSFTTGVGQWIQSTASDFNAGTQSGTMTNSSGGVQMAPAFSDSFSGTALSSAWKTTATGGGAASTTVNNGTLSVLATEVDSVQTYSSVLVEGTVSFGASPYQHFGMATGLNSVNGNSWAMFSTAGSTNTLYARVNANGSMQDVSLGTLPSGYHDYLIKQVSGGFQFLVDGVLQTTINATFPSGSALKIVLSDYNGNSQAPLRTQQILIPSYTSGSTFTSSVFNATRMATFGTVSWTVNLPAGTGITVMVRTADASGNWTGWVQVTSGQPLPASIANGQYLQYSVTFTTTDPTLTPVLTSIDFNWT
jgi:hypothetical protein